MVKFKCEKCDGFCELTINAADLEDVMPEHCPSADILAEWVMVPRLYDGSIFPPKSDVPPEERAAFGPKMGAS
jgi:hypothetical protein